MVDNSEMRDEQFGKIDDLEHASRPTPTGQEDKWYTSSELEPSENKKGSSLEKPLPPDNSQDPNMPGLPLPVNKGEIPWFSRKDIDELHSRWNTIQVQFIDEPCSSVEQGEALVAETVERVKQMIADQQKNLDLQWINNDNISTEELRITLQNYRSFLNRLLKL